MIRHTLRTQTPIAKAPDPKGARMAFPMSAPAFGANPHYDYGPVDNGVACPAGVHGAAQYWRSQDELDAGATPCPYCKDGPIYPVTDGNGEVVFATLQGMRHKCRNFWSMDTCVAYILYERKIAGPDTRPTAKE